MESSTSAPSPPQMAVHKARASTVIVQRVPPESAELFLQWQRGISAAVADFPGYQSTEVYPPPDRRQSEWVIVIHFDDPKTLQDWLDSPKRAEWVAKLPGEIRDFRQKMLPSGFASWFTGLDQDSAPLPHWKMFLTVLLGLYPAVMLLSFFLAPHTQRFGMAVSMLIGNAASVSFLEWLGMPVISRFLGPWLKANGKEGKALSFLGLVLILFSLAVMTFVFHLVTPRP